MRPDIDSDWRKNVFKYLAAVDPKLSSEVERAWVDSKQEGGRLSCSSDGKARYACEDEGVDEKLQFFRSRVAQYEAPATHAAVILNPETNRDLYDELQKSLPLDQEEAFTLELVQGGGVASGANAEVSEVGVRRRLKPGVLLHRDSPKEVGDRVKTETYMRKTDLQGVNSNIAMEYAVHSSLQRRLNDHSSRYQLFTTPQLTGVVGTALLESDLVTLSSLLYVTDSGDDAVQMDIAYLFGEIPADLIGKVTKLYRDLHRNALFCSTEYALDNTVEDLNSEMITVLKALWASLDPRKSNESWSWEQDLPRLLAIIASERNKAGLEAVTFSSNDDDPDLFHPFCEKVAESTSRGKGSQVMILKYYVDMFEGSATILARLVCKVLEVSYVRRHEERASSAIVGAEDDMLFEQRALRLCCDAPFLWVNTEPAEKKAVLRSIDTLYMHLVSRLQAESGFFDGDDWPAWCDLPVTARQMKCQQVYDKLRSRYQSQARRVVECLDHGDFFVDQAHRCGALYLAKGVKDAMVVANDAASLPPMERNQYRAWVVQEFLALFMTLRSMHEVGVLHQDIKPENIFLMPDGRFVFGDLGAASTVSGIPDKTRGIAAFGAYSSACYDVPVKVRVKIQLREQARRGNVSMKDIYALLISMWACYTARGDWLINLLSYYRSADWDSYLRQHGDGSILGESLSNVRPCWGNAVDECDTWMRRMIVGSRSCEYEFSHIISQLSDFNQRNQSLFSDALDSSKCFSLPRLSIPSAAVSPGGAGHLDQAGQLSVLHSTLGVLEPILRKQSRTRQGRVDQSGMIARLKTIRELRAELVDDGLVALPGVVNAVNTSLRLNGDYAAISCDQVKAELIYKSLVGAHEFSDYHQSEVMKAIQSLVANGSSEEDASCEELITCDMSCRVPQTAVVSSLISGIEARLISQAQQAPDPEPSWSCAVS